MIILNISYMAAAVLFASSVYAAEVGQVAPNIMGRDFEEKMYRLKNDTEKPKVINFFSISCSPCRQEMPELAKLEKQHPGVKFISVHTPREPQEEKVENVVKFVKSLPGAPSHIVQTTGGVQDAYKYAGLPHTIVLDKNNVVLMNVSGFTPTNMQRLTKLVKELSTQ
jgi:thiol-disulfide isomerase/thioredoxin